MARLPSPCIQLPYGPDAGFRMQCVHVAQRTCICAELKWSGFGITCHIVVHSGAPGAIAMGMRAQALPASSSSVSRARRAAPSGTLDTGRRPVTASSYALPHRSRPRVSPSWRLLGRGSPRWLGCTATLQGRPLDAGPRAPTSGDSGVPNRWQAAAHEFRPVQAREAPIPRYRPSCHRMLVLTHSSQMPVLRGSGAGGLQSSADNLT